MLNDVFVEQMVGEEENAHVDLLAGMLGAPGGTKPHVHPPTNPSRKEGACRQEKRGC